MNIIEENAALIIIDVQRILDDPTQGTLNNPDAEKNILKLLAHWRIKKLPLFFVQYISPRRSSPFHEDAPGSKLKDSLQMQPGETRVVKHFESAFMKTGLEQLLRKASLETLVFAGFYSDQCVASTVKVANNLGFKVFVVSDASATTGCQGYDGTFYEAEDIHNLTLGSLKRDRISIITTNDVLF